MATVWISRHHWWDGHQLRPRLWAQLSIQHQKSKADSITCLSMSSERESVQHCYHSNTLYYLRDRSKLAVGGSRSSSVSVHGEVWWTVWRRPTFVVMYFNRIWTMLIILLHLPRILKETRYLNKFPGWTLGVSGSQWRTTCPRRSHRCDLVLRAGWCTSRDLPEIQRWNQVLKNIVNSESTGGELKTVSDANSWFSCCWAQCVVGWVVTPSLVTEEPWEDQTQGNDKSAPVWTLLLKIKCFMLFNM